MNFLAGVIDEKSRQVLIISLQWFGHIFQIYSALILLAILDRRSESKFKDVCIDIWIAFSESPLKHLPKLLIAKLFSAKQMFNLSLIKFFNNKILYFLFIASYPVLIGLGFGYFYGIYIGLITYTFTCLIYLVRFKKVPLYIIAVISLSTSSILFFYLLLKSAEELNIFYSTIICIIFFPYATLLYLTLKVIGVIGILSRIIGSIGLYVLNILLMIINLFMFVFLPPIASLHVAIFAIFRHSKNGNNSLISENRSIPKVVFKVPFEKLSYFIKSIQLYFFSKSQGYPFLIKPEDDEDAIMDKVYLVSVPIASLRGMYEHADRIISPYLLAIILPSSLLLTLSSVALGSYIDPGVSVAISPRLLSINFIFDLLTVYTTAKLLYWLLVRYSLKRTLLVIVLDLSLSALYGSLSLYLIFINTSSRLNLFEICNILIGKSLDGSIYIFGSYFWLMHTTFIPTAIIISLLAIAYIAHYLHIPFEKLSYKIGAINKPLYFISTLLLTTGVICSGFSWLI